MTRLRVVAVALLTLVATARRGRAQFNNAGINATADIITVGMTVTTLSNLNFGSVPKGVATTVLPTAAGAGEWQVSGNKNAFVSITFTLPTQLVNIQAAPGSNMPISFSATSAIWNRQVNSPGAGTVFDPNAGTTGRFGSAATPLLFIWVGGTVNPPAAAKPGIYQGTVIVSLTYL